MARDVSFAIRKAVLCCAIAAAAQSGVARTRWLEVAAQWMARAEPGEATPDQPPGIDQKPDRNDA